RLGHDDVADLLLGRARLHVVALFLLAGAAQRSERAGAAVVFVRQRAGDGELAALAMVVAAAAGARRLGALGCRGMAARPAMAAVFLLLDDRFGGFGRGGRLGGAGFFFRLQAGLLGRGFLSLAILFGATALFLARLDLAAVLAPARFLERGEARILGFAQQLLLELAAARDLVALARLARDRSRRSGRLGRRRGRLRGGRRGL